MVAVIGAGIAGVSTAYYLSHLLSPSSQLGPITIIDPNDRLSDETAFTASSKAGAFLSNSWGDGTKRQTLFRKSYSLHKDLAIDLSLTSFRELSTVYRDVRVANNSNGSGHLPFLELKGQAAMVDPHELTSSLLREALQRGAKFKQGFVDGLQMSSDCDNVETTSPSNENISAAKILFEDGSEFRLRDNEPVVIALGPWSSRVEDWLNVPVPIDGVVSTSLIWKDVYEGEHEHSSHDDDRYDIALFCEEDTNGCHLEIFPRAHDQSIYVSGCGGSDVFSPSTFRSSNLQPNPTQHCDPNFSRAKAAQRTVKDLLSPSSPVSKVLPTKMRTDPPSVVQACIRPTTPDGVPVVGRLLNNVYIVTGGGPWGITWGPLMGKSLALMIIEDEDAPMPMGPYRPSRFDTFVYRSLLKTRSGGSQQRHPDQRR